MFQQMAQKEEEAKIEVDLDFEDLEQWIDQFRELVDEKVSQSDTIQFAYRAGPQACPVEDTGALPNE